MTEQYVTLPVVEFEALTHALRAARGLINLWDDSADSLGSEWTGLAQRIESLRAAIGHVPPVSTRDWLVWFAHKVASEDERQARLPGSVWCLMLRKDEAHAVLDQIDEDVQRAANSHERPGGDAE